MVATRPFFPVVVLSSLLSGSLLGCASHSCADVYVSCGQTQITLQTADNAWQAGDYVLALTLDGAQAQCTISVPATPSSRGVAGACGLGGSSVGTLELAAVQSCPPVVCGGGACGGMSCTPVAGQFQMNLTIQGLPTQVGIDLTVNGAPLASETLAPTAATTEPNGQGCGTCTNASASVMVPAG